MRVTLLSYTQDAERLCAAAAHSCYSDKGASELMEEWDEGKNKRWLGSPLASGHHSVIEHASYSFSIEGASRALTHQLVRHRLASFSQMSQRYVDMKDADYVVPASIAADPELAARYRALMQSIWEEYRFLSEKVPVEDARYVLPNACATNITVTMNARELWHFFELRTCRRAQDEIRQMADEMLRLVREASPFIFKDAGPPCVSRGKCTEGKMSCGRPRTELKQE
ncbi:MAG: FAD-dependent thymidylate synthase [Methanomassiliicoccus sp.]|nr:FAD-dependent thymidylate synthase [Methanomassiliicoccus sp.]